VKWPFQIFKKSFNCWQVEIASQHLLDGQLIEGWFDIKKGNKVRYTFRRFAELRRRKKLVELLSTSLLLIRDAYPGSDFFHPGSQIQGQKDSGSRIRIRIKEFKYF
jgi:hypothetical protein